MNYWVDSAALKAKAMSHTAEMAQKYRQEIANSVKGVVDYPDSCILPAPSGMHPDMKVYFEKCDSVSMLEVLHRLGGGKMCVLDFADYMHPGGKFMQGSSAQEESLCHASFLYNVLKSEHVRELFYDKHKGHSNYCLYSNHTLYIPDVVFSVQEDIKCDVIICAAPNKNAIIRYHSYKLGEADRAMRERCNAVLQAAAMRRVDTLILGAFGCGVFGNDPGLVALEFKSLLAGRYAGSFKTVVFAVPDDMNGRYFDEVFSPVGWNK